jgi:BirA family transcriptional regulator, biotin operon repressor / biotin---[acetyl-CoA-carboxylase] ligase
MVRVAWRYDGRTAEELAELMHAPRAWMFETVTSTMDIAHDLAAEGAAAGTVVIADAQTAGRGRHGRVWQSEPGRGIWLTLVERPSDHEALQVLSLRLGIAASRILDRFAGETISLKWPNDLYLGRQKLAGILVEARWRERQPEWLAIGFGLNVHPPEWVDAAGLTPGVQRVDVLASLVPALHAAACIVGPLTSEELRHFAERDLATGRECVEPARGRVKGVNASGELLVETESDGQRRFRTGSLVFTSQEEVAS